MQIDIQSRNFPLTVALLRHINRRLLTLLGGRNAQISGRNTQIQYIRVWLSDINGPRGGVDKCCQIQVTLSHLPDVVIKDTAVNLYAAIYRAADRTVRTIECRLARKRDRGRSASWRHLELVTELNETNWQ